MNYTLTSTLGIDKVIQSIQVDLYDQLSWSGTVDGYGRIYRNTKDDVVIPEYYQGDNEYKEVYYDDKNSCNFMFVTDEKSTTEDETLFSNETKVVFMVDLSKILPGETHRADETAHRDVIQILRSIAYGRYSITGIDTGIGNVFNGFETSKIKFHDIQPLHCFSVNLKLSYYLTDKCE